MSKSEDHKESSGGVKNKQTSELTNKMDEWIDKLINYTCIH